jgi:hypothetical protein
MLLFLLVDSLYLAELLLLYFDLLRLVLLAFIRGARWPIIKNHFIHVLLIIINMKLSCSTR